MTITAASKLPKNVWILSASLALAMSSVPMMVLVSGLLATHIAPSEKLATLPMALVVVGTACSAMPAALMMKKVGRKKGGFIGFGFGLVSCILGYIASSQASFGLLLSGGFAMGVFMAFGQQFRFAALESVSDPSQYGPALSALMAGGLLSAILGPEIAVLGKEWLQSPYGYAGSFALLAMVLLVSVVIFSFFREPPHVETASDHVARPLANVIRSPLFGVAALTAAISYGVMSLIMTATPINMVEICGYDIQDTKRVIQIHILSMFAPSLISGWLMKVLGPGKLMMIGALAYGAVLVVGTGGQELIHFWLSLIMLGVGWNFLFVSGTALLPRSYRPAERFKAQAVNDLIVFSCQALASLSAGWILFSLGWNLLLLACVPFLVLVTVLAVRQLLADRAARKASNPILAE